MELGGRLTSRLERIALGILAAGLAVLLATGCGRQAPEPPPAALMETPQVAFGGRPLEIPALPCASAILMEPVSGQVLYEQNAHERRAPASIAKMTLELVVMREIAERRLALSDSISVSAWASQIGGSQVYLAEREVFPLETMMKAIAIHSANDACVAVAEHVAGTTDGFVRLMNQEAEALRLESTHYVNVHGLDDEPGEGNSTTAYDIATVARELIRFPEILRWSSTIQEHFRPPDEKNPGFLLENTNKLLGNFSGLDGLKTGYTNKAGFCLCATAERNGMRLISVVLGATSNRERFGETASLLAAGFNSYTPVRVGKKGEAVGEPVPIKGGKRAAMAGVAPHDFTVILSRPDDRRMEKKVVPLDGLRAPIRAGQRIATLQVSTAGTVRAEMPIVAQEDVPRAGFLARLFRRN